MAAQGRALRLIRPDEAAPLQLFCGHCAHSPHIPPDVTLASRVCESCGLGLLLEASRDAAPGPADPFLVVDHAMSISAVSRRAEQFLAVSEPDVVGTHLKDHLTPADTDIPAAQSFFTQVLLAASGNSQPTTVAVRPAGVFGVRYWARVASCGPSSAALLLLVTMD